MGVGKSYLADHVLVPLLEKTGKTMVLAFADQLKINTMVKHGVSFHDAFHAKPPCVRKLLQHEGTEMGRQTQGDDIWIRYADSWMQLFKENLKYKHFVIPDVRFQNEIDYVRSKGGKVVLVVAHERNAERVGDQVCVSAHPSETQQLHSFDAVVNNNRSVDASKIRDQLFDVLFA